MYVIIFCVSTFITCHSLLLCVCMRACHVFTNEIWIKHRLKLPMSRKGVRGPLFLPLCGNLPISIVAVSYLVRRHVSFFLPSLFWLADYFFFFGQNSIGTSDNAILSPSPFFLLCIHLLSKVDEWMNECAKFFSILSKDRKSGQWRRIRWERMTIWPR